MSHEHNHTHGANKNLDDQFHNHHGYMIIEAIGNFDQ